MASFSFGHWLTVLSVIALPAFAIAIITSNARVTRLRFLYWTLAWLSLVIALVAAIALADEAIIGILSAFALYGFWFFYVRCLTGRVLDAGYSRAVASLSYIPVINLICMVVLLFVPSKDGLAENELTPAATTPWQNQ